MHEGPGVCGFRERFVMEPQDVAVTADGGIVEVTLQPGRAGVGQPAPEQVAVEHCLLVGVENDESHVTESRWNCRSRRAAVLRRGCRSLVDELYVQPVRVRHVSEAALGLPRKGNELAAPRARPQHPTGFQLRPYELCIGDDDAKVTGAWLPGGVATQLGALDPPQLVQVNRERFTRHVAVDRHSR